MGISSSTVQTLSALAYLHVTEEESVLLAEKLNTILAFATSLHAIPTEGVAPLFHPIDLAQPYRQDTACAQDNFSALENAAPAFTEGFYLVPLVIS
jgi:aspartyl-tRNA(Asn)/glutamyl-tRNA(Gln) amidotransferase subunit C